jgi:hypothetical protein
MSGTDSADRSDGCEPVVVAGQANTTASATQDAATAAAQDVEQKRAENRLKRHELAVRKLEARIKLEDAQRPWWRRPDPLTLAILGAVLTIGGNIAVGFFNNKATIQQAREKAIADLELEQTKAQYTLILQAIATTDRKAAGQNIDFFIEAGLLQDKDGKIRRARDTFQPVLPSLSGASAPASMPPKHASEVAKLYNFPAELDGSGQVIGILEFGGGYDRGELAKAFASIKKPMPDVTDVPVLSGKNLPSEMGGDGEVYLNIEVVGEVAPKAAQRIYFAPWGAEGFVRAIQAAVADHVSVLLIAWGQAELAWDGKYVMAVNNALRDAAMQGVTIIASAGSAPTEAGKQSAVLFPASSPWVLAVGGSSIRMSGSTIESEVPWRDEREHKGNGDASGIDVSVLFDRPSWQKAAALPTRRDGKAGRCIPDVSAIAAPSMLVSINGRIAQVGGTGVSASMWAGLIALTNQGLGHNVGHITPLLYEQIGPSAVLRPATDDKGRSATAGWNPGTGWGAPDGQKLLSWLKAHS